MIKKIFYSLILTALNFSLWANTPLQYSVQKIAHFHIKSSINPATLNYLENSFQKAGQEKADLFVITLNTPGGLVTTTKEILTLFGESTIPLVVWVRPAGASATSAGAIIASAAHFLFMGQGTNIGAATPVSLGKDNNQSSDKHKKAVNDLTALVVSLSETHGRNPKPFREMIEKASSFSSQEAKKRKLINGLANSQEEIIQQLESKAFSLQGKTFILSFKNPEWTEYPMDLGQEILNTFANPSTAYILFLIGAALLYLELQAPGGFIAGALGTFSLIMAGIGFQVLPLNMGALGLIVLSFVLLAMEVSITSYGILALGGLASLITGSLFLFRTDDAYLQFSATLVYSTVAALSVFLGFILILFLKDQKNIGREKFNSLVGHKAQVIGEIPCAENNFFHYQVKVGGEVWKAKSHRILRIGDFAEVKDQEENTIVLILA